MNKSFLVQKSSRRSDLNTLNYGKIKPCGDILITSQRSCVNSKKSASYRCSFFDLPDVICISVFPVNDELQDGVFLFIV